MMMLRQIRRSLILLTFGVMTTPVIALPLDAVPRITAQTERPVTVRDGPGPHYAPIDRLEAGEEVLITARNSESGNWLRVELGASDGWLAHFTVELNGEVDDLRLAPPAEAQPLEVAPGEVWAYVFRTVNVRTQPTMDSEVICQLTNGDIVAVTGRDGTGNDWLQVDLDGITGWLAYFTVTLVGDPRDLPVIDPLTDDPVVTVTPQDLAPVTVQAFRTVNVRGGPNIEAPVVGQLTHGDIVPVWGRSDAGNNWLQVNLGGMPGWVAYFTVNVTGDPDELAIIPSNN
jgi:uncharacterized protein YraI